MTRRDNDAALARRLRRAVSGLPPLEREVLLSISVDGLSYVELGARLGISAAEVEALFASALAALSQAIEEVRSPWWRRPWRRR